MFPHNLRSVALTAVATYLPCGCVVYVNRPGELAHCPAGHDADRPQHRPR